MNVFVKVTFNEEIAFTWCIWFFKNLSDLLHSESTKKTNDNKSTTTCVKQIFMNGKSMTVSSIRNKFYKDPVSIHCLNLMSMWSM